MAYMAKLPTCPDCKGVKMAGGWVCCGCNGKAVRPKEYPTPNIWAGLGAKNENGWTQ